MKSSIRSTPRRTDQRSASGRGLEVLHESPDTIWEFKRQNQRRDIDAIRAARATNATMSWFTEEQASKAEIEDEPL